MKKDKKKANDRNNNFHIPCCACVYIYFILYFNCYVNVPANGWPIICHILLTKRESSGRVLVTNTEALYNINNSGKN